ncbi:MAG: aminotransferase class V-fold PLP-dependent enzyme [Chitinophagaceae bacterium]|nr:aminotransferase class V-fold PLP-dependent enzyme [Chitinophagaceae bacterium]
MQKNRRTFLRNIGMGAIGALSANSLFAEKIEHASARLKNTDPLQAALDEDYWSIIQQAYSVSPDIINFNNGGVSPSPRIVQDAVEKYNRMSNQGPSYYMWRILDKGREPLRQKLAALAGCDAEEVAVNRNATEALNSVIYGMDLKKGDEVIGSMHDYPNMMAAWRQRAQREGIVYKQITFNFPIENDEEIVDEYRKLITPKTKVIHVTHVVNWVGQIMPVRKIADMAHQRGIEVICDSAHGFGLLDFKIPDLHCDYLGTSLHKFLSAPIGSGMLWIRKEKIPKIWPLLCNDNPRSDNIRKFETLGTRSFPIEQGIVEAIDFHNAIGPKRKEERVRYLKNYWAEKVQPLKKVKLHTSLRHDYSCAICGVSIDGIESVALSGMLFDKYRIHTTAMVYANVNCVRVTPHVYTTLKEVDTLAQAIGELSA